MDVHHEPPQQQPSSIKTKGVKEKFEVNHDCFDSVELRSDFVLMGVDSEDINEFALEESSTQDNIDLGLPPRARRFKIAIQPIKNSVHHKTYHNNLKAATIITSLSDDPFSPFQPMINAGGRTSSAPATCSGASSSLEPPINVVVGCGRSARVRSLDSISWRHTFNHCYEWLSMHSNSYNPSIITSRKSDHHHTVDDRITSDQSLTTDSMDDFTVDSWSSSLSSATSSPMSSNFESGNANSSKPRPISKVERWFNFKQMQNNHRKTKRRIHIENLNQSIISINQEVDNKSDTTLDNIESKDNFTVDGARSYGHTRGRQGKLALTSLDAYLATDYQFDLYARGTYYRPSCDQRANYLLAVRSQ